MNAPTSHGPSYRSSSPSLPALGRPSPRAVSAGSPYVFRRKPVVQHRVTLEEAIPELRDLRELLEDHLAALRSIYLEHREVIGLHLQGSAVPLEELRALASPQAPWVSALDETRRLIRSSFLEIAAACVRAHSAKA